MSDTKRAPVVLNSLRDAILALPPKSRVELRYWLEDLDDLDGRRTSLTDDELDVLIAVRAAELEDDSTATNALASRLNLSKDALVARINRLNDKAYRRYLESHKTSTASVFYSTVYNTMIRQPATAMMALLFDENKGLTGATIGDLEKFGIERDINGVSYYFDYLTELQYFQRRGETTFGPGRRLSLERKYIRWLAERWPVRSLQDMIEVSRCKNEILWQVWQQETTPQSNPARRTQRALIECATQGSVHERGGELAEHAIRSLVADGSLKERLESTVDSEVYFLNERHDPGHCVVTWPSTAFLLTALSENLVPTRGDIDRSEVQPSPSHIITTDDLVEYALRHCLSLNHAIHAIEFCERAGYITVHRDGQYSGRIWRTERLTAQAPYIKRLGATYRPETWVGVSPDDSAPG